MPNIHFECTYKNRIWTQLLVRNQKFRRLGLAILPIRSLVKGFGLENLPDTLERMRHRVYEAAEHTDQSLALVNATVSAARKNWHVVDPISTLSDGRAINTLIDQLQGQWELNLLPVSMQNRTLLGFLADTGIILPGPPKFTHTLEPWMLPEAVQEKTKGAKGYTVGFFHSPWVTVAGAARVFELSDTDLFDLMAAGMTSMLEMQNQQFCDNPMCPNCAPIRLMYEFAVANSEPLLVTLSAFFGLTHAYTQLAQSFPSSRFFEPDYVRDN